MKSDMEVVLILFVVVFFGDSLVLENVHVIIGSVVDCLGIVLVVFLAVVVLLVEVVLLAEVVLLVVVLVVVVFLVVVVLLVVVVVLLVVEGFAVAVVLGLLVVGFVVVVDPTSELVLSLGLILLKIFSCHQGTVDVDVGCVVVQNNILGGILLLFVFGDVVFGDMEVVVLILVVVFVGSGNKAEAENISESNFSSARFAFV